MQPPTLVTTADRDDRGHGSGTPVWMQIEEMADGLSFLGKALGNAQRPPYAADVFPAPGPTTWTVWVG